MLIQGDALTELQKLESDTIDCCITSPPYWALRDYKVDGQLGLEPTIDEYINKLTAIFDQVQRVLKLTGSCWVVIGDTYAGNTKQTGRNDANSPFRSFDGNRRESGPKTKLATINDIPEKSLCMIPERFAIAMIDHGWILRNKIIWYKPNCMPSSAKDRFTVDWEYVYFFTKSQKYFFETQYEPFNTSTQNYPERVKSGEIWPTNRAWKYEQMANRKSGCHGSEKYRALLPLGRIKRCVWKISTKPFKDAHFAVFPPQLIEPMIKAGCPTEGIVLDPFMGTGTTGMVALQNARNFIGIELNPEYVAMATKRLDPWLKQERLVTIVETR